MLDESVREGGVVCFSRWPASRLWPSVGGCVPAQADIKVMDSRPLGVRMTVGAPGGGTQCKMQVIRAVDGSGVRSKGYLFKPWG